MTQRGALFVCVANICRSPIAEACFKHLLEERGELDEWRVDSAGVNNYMLGSPPDPRGADCMMRKNIYHHVASHRARQFSVLDFYRFDFIFALDQHVLMDLEAMTPLDRFRAQVFLLGAFDNDTTYNGSIADPYLSTHPGAFERVFQQCYRSCRNFLAQLELSGTMY